MLISANGGATKTEIMRKAYLSYAQLKEYVSVLVENGLLEYLEGAQMYRTTAKGLNYIQMSDKMGETLQASSKIPK